MRLLTRQIHRAFPELDSYDDEQCGRFIKAARGGLWVRFYHTLAILSVALPLLVVGIGLAAWVGEKFQIYSHSLSTLRLWLQTGLWLIVTGMLLGVGLVSGYLIRDVLLRRRIRYVLRTRGGCPSCGYSVIGLAVTVKDNGASTVRCPECGLEVEVDASLSELVREDLNAAPGDRPVIAAGATGRVFVAGQRVDLSVFWTTKRKRLFKRVTITLAIIVFGGGGLVVGINELFVRWQAGNAQTALVKAQADYLALAERGYAAAGMGKDVMFSGPSVWDQIDEINDQIDLVDNATWKLSTSSGADFVYPDFTSIAYPTASLRYATTPEEAAKNQAAIDLARSLIPQYNQANAFAALAPLATNPNARLPEHMLSVDLATLDLSMLGRQRALCRVLAGRMALAAEAGDRETFLETLRGILAMARALQAQPQLISHLVGIAIDGLANEQLRMQLLQGRIRPDWIPAIEQVLTQRTPLALDHANEGERLLATATIANYFANPANARLGRFSPGFRTMIGMSWTASPNPAWKVRLGTLSENLAAINSMYDSTIPQVGLEGWERLSTPPITFPQNSLGLVNLTMGSLNQTRYLIDNVAANRRGIDIWLALERFRADTGSYPASLSELVPKHIASLPIDPWTGKPALYRRFAPGTDPDNRPFVLYFTGPDGADDAGTGVVPGQTSFSPSKDHVVNDPNR